MVLGDPAKGSFDPKEVVAPRLRTTAVRSKQTLKRPILVASCVNTKAKHLH